MIPPAIVTENLVKNYGRGRALDGLSLSVPAKSIMGLLGCNGAGKTTWMMTVAGFVMPNSGKIDILGRGPFDALVHGGKVSILPQDSELPLDINVRELLIGFAKLQGLSTARARNAADELLHAFNLDPQAQKTIRALSHGMRKRLMVAQAFIGGSEIVLLDEPLSGLDPVEAERMRAFIRSRRSRQTIVISSHNLNDIEKMCTHVAFVSDGKLERVERLAELTSVSGRVVYRLRTMPENPSGLESSAEGLSIFWNEERRELTAQFPEGFSPEEINSLLLPKLLSCGIVSVTSGRSLEEAYLERVSKR
jgi:ABC-type multidrug transport system ATPase subunit